MLYQITSTHLDHLRGLSPENLPFQPTASIRFTTSKLSKLSTKRVHVSAILRKQGVAVRTSISPHQFRG
jgi:hypothetical protein